MKISVSILFFSISASVTVTKQFGNSGGSSMAGAHAATRRGEPHPALNSGGSWPAAATSFTTIMSGGQAGAWTDYCGAFAG
jgi:hypothetical protein